ncbi:MAG: NAD(P)/FAD-dependent oxidoreductase [Dehalococcoidia bacterium]|nr:NAD(P)/FAD-dependent oxidoreductase [Dehalococcoidia bacterium]
MKSTEYDVAVVGAGPGGSQTARLLADQGHRVLVLEEHKSVGLPVHCSGFVTPRTLSEAGVSAGLVLNEVKGAVVHSPGGKSLELGGDKVRALVLDREAVDVTIADRAASAGAEYQLRTKVEDISFGPSGALLRAKEAGQWKDYKARLVVGADGVRSRVAAQIDRPEAQFIWCAGAELRLPDHPTDMVRIYVGNELAPGWFAWTIPMGGGSVRMGIGSVMGNTGEKPRKLLDHLVQSHPGHFRGMEITSFGGGFIPLYAPSRTYADRVLLVGDAALQTKPTTGGGIYTSLVAARHAAETADAALVADELGPWSLSEYERAWREEIGGELDRGTDVRETFLRMRDHQLDRVVDLLGQPILRPIINRYGDIDFPSRLFGRLLSLVPVLRILLGLPEALPGRWLRMARNNGLIPSS